jgi:cyanobactin cluster PatC/TenC/TruC protein
MATQDTPATAQTGLQDYARKHAKKGKGTKAFRRGRIWT